MDYVDKKNVTLADLIVMERKLIKELNIAFKFSFFYDDAVEITIMKGDAKEIITVNRLFKNMDQAYSELKMYIESAYNNIIEYHDNALLAMFYKEYDPEDRSSNPIMIYEDGTIMQAVYVDMYGRF